MTPIFRCNAPFVDAVRRDLARPHRFAAERVGFISVRSGSTPRSLLLIAENYHSVSDEDYLDDHTVGAMMGPDAIRKALDVALLQSVGMFHVHMHEHRGRPRFSATDLSEQKKFVPDFFKICPKMPHGALVLSHDRAVGRVWIGPHDVKPIAEFNIIGSPMLIDLSARRA